MVREPTNVDATGQTKTLPKDAEFLHEWESYWVEVWVSTSDEAGVGVAGGTVDLAYDTSRFTATQIKYGAAFPDQTTGTIDDAAGLIRNLGALTTQGGIGDTVSATVEVTAAPSGNTFTSTDTPLDIVDPHKRRGPRTTTSDIDISSSETIAALVVDVDITHEAEGDLKVHPGIVERWPAIVGLRRRWRHLEPDRSFAVHRRGPRRHLDALGDR